MLLETSFGFEPSIAVHIETCKISIVVLAIMIKGGPSLPQWKWRLKEYTSQ
jgi:hypothetical protein